MTSLADIARALAEAGLWARDLHQPEERVAEAARALGMAVLEGPFGPGLGERDAVALFRELAAESEQAQAREAALQAADADAHRFPAQPTARELVGLLGGPNHASDVLSSVPRSGLPQVIDAQQGASQQALMDAFWARGGGRFPAGQQPHPAPSRAPRTAPIPPEWKDGTTYYPDGRPVA